jgi:hypothetical protein
LIRAQMAHSSDRVGPVRLAQVHIGFFGKDKSRMGLLFKQLFFLV